MANESATTATDEQADMFQRFQSFLKSFRTESGSLKYREMIQRLPVTGERSVVIDYNELLDFDPQLARQILDEPEDFFKTTSEAVKTIVDLEDRDYVTKITESGHEFRARLRNVTAGKVKLRMIRANHIGKLIMVDGIITRVSEVKPQLMVATFECSCGQKQFIEQFEGRFTAPPACPACKREGPFNLIVEESKFIDWQKIRIQEMPEELPPGQMPRSLDAIIKDDLVDVARPGDRVAIIGALMSVQDFAPKRGRLTTFRTYINSNYVDTMDKESEKVEITPEEERFIIELAKDEWIHQKIIKSIAPSIYGLEDVKEAIALALFGGVAKTLPDGVKIRGEINVLLVGDPGTAKSVHGKEKIYVGRQTKGVIRWAREPIGALVDHLIERQPQRVTHLEGTEGLSLNREDEFLTQAMDPLSLKTRQSIVYEVSRHQADHLIHIRTRSGRSVTATPDHSFTTIDNGQITVLAAKDLKVGTYLPVARHIELDVASSHIDLADEFPETDLVSSETINSQVALVNTGQSSGRLAASASNISAKHFSEMTRGIVPIPDGNLLRRTMDTSWFPRFLDLSPELGRIIGLYLAEGNVEKNNVRISAKYHPIRRILKKDLEEVFGKSSTADGAILLCQASIASWFRTNFGTGARYKQAPFFLLTTPYSFRCSLLSGYFSGDGTVDKRGAAVTSSTRSIRLARQLCDLLATLGIFATVRRRIIRKGRYKGHIFWMLRIQSADLLEYSNQIGFISPAKAKALKRLVERVTSRKHYQSRDIIPNYGALLKNAGKELRLTGKRGHWTRNFLAELRGKTQRQRMGREYLRKVLLRLNQLKRADNQSPSLDWLTKLAESDIFWDPITKVDHTQRRTTVYDIATSDGHFILAEGNLVTHNSQLLMYTAGLAPRGLYTSGKGSTAAGLTAAVLRDADTGDMTLEAGALVLADRGVACLHPSTKVIFNDRVVAVESLFDGNLKAEAISVGERVQICPVRGLVRSFDVERLDPVDDECTLVRRKMYSGSLVKAKLASGFEVMLTPNHKLVDGASLQWKEIGSFKTGELVLAPLKMAHFIGKRLATRVANEVSPESKLDYFLDRIVSIDHERYDGWVYDLHTKRLHNFVGNGVLMHNCVDEFDKMNPQDRVAIHQAMEQQTISIAKAGIVATLNARTAILAAANPALGRYNSFKNPAENISLPVTVLSRFDLIFVMVDKPESERDKKMAEHVISLHSSKATGNEAPINPQLLRKYISYAKKNPPPVLTDEAAKKIQEFYLETRAMGENPESPVPITARQLEALVRLAESRAKMALKKEITVDDAEAVIRLMTTSLKMVGIDRETMRADIDTIMVGRTKTQRERVDLIITVVRELGEGSKEGFVQIEKIVEAAAAQGVERQFALDTINRLIKEGVLFEPRQGIVKKA